MSLVAQTIDIWRSQTQSDAWGGETEIPALLFSGIETTISFPDKDPLATHDTGGGTQQGPGPLTRADRVVFIDPWDGSWNVLVADHVKPNPPVDWLPAQMNVIGVRPYYDGSAGELQLDVEDVG
jgi:hypothetical protein